MTALLLRLMTNTLEAEAFQRLEELGLFMPELAEVVDILKSELRQLCHHGDPCLSEPKLLSKTQRCSPRTC